MHLDDATANVPAQPGPRAKGSDQAHVYFFSGEIPQGDPEGDMAEVFRKVRTLSHAAGNEDLGRFLRQATNAIREEIFELPKNVQDTLPWVGNILDWTHHVVALRNTGIGGSIDRALACVYQMSLVLVEQPSIPLTIRHEAWQTCLLGKGIGLLTAACLGLAKSHGELAYLAAIVVRIAFRTGLMVDRVSGSVEAPDHSFPSSKAWLACVHGLTEQAVQCEVDKYNTAQNLPLYRAAFICNTTESSVSVSGPPSTIKGLIAALKKSTKSRCVPMPKIQGATHADHLYTFRDAEWIVPAIDLQSSLHTRLVLSTTGLVPAGTKATELFRMIVDQDLSAKQIKSEVDVDAVEGVLTSLGAARCTIYTVRRFSHADEFRSRLRSRMPSLELTDVEMSPSLATRPNINNTKACRPSHSKIAVVGMSCRFPDGADDVNKFWNLLAEGRDAHRTIPADRFDAQTHVDHTGQTRNTSTTPYGCFINEPGLFDAAFLSISRREAEQTDPMHRLALVTAHEALEHAGYTAGSSRISAHRVGTFYGQASDDYRRINYFNKFSGPSFSCDTACSSSLATLQLACTSLWADDADMLVVGGLNVLTNCDVYAGLSHGHFLSKTGGCKTWDKGADGYCRADGIGSVVLKRLEDAEADNDNVLGIILSAATNHSAEAVSITHPHTASQAELYRQVIWRAGLDARDVGYVEFHGTGTQSGDATELAAVTSVFAPSVRPRSLAQPLYIDSVKANVGHGEAAAGIMALIKSLLVLQKGTIPPHVGIKTELSMHFPVDAEKRNLHIPWKPTAWPKKESGKRTVIINNFGAAGGNTTVAMEEADQRERTETDDRTLHLVTVSAKSRPSLEGNLSQLLEWVQNNASSQLCDVAYTTTARKAHHPLRTTFLIRDLYELKRNLESRLSTLDEVVVVPTKQPPIVFAYTGQGVCYTGLGADLYHRSDSFRRDVEFLNDLGMSMELPSVLSSIDGSSTFSNDLPSPVIHLAIVVIEIALTWYWRSLGTQPQSVIGHSLGELAALNAAGVLSTADTLFIAGKRAQLLDRVLTRDTHGMVAAFASLREIDDALQRIPYNFGLYNSPKCHVLTGPAAEIGIIAERLKLRGIQTHRLNIPYAFHSSQMDLVMEGLTEIIRGVQFQPSKLPTISPQTGQVVPAGSREIQARYVINAIRDPVHYYDALNTARDSGLVTPDTLWLEVGPHPVCTNYVKNTLETDKAFPSLQRNECNWTTVTTALAAMHRDGVSIDWRQFHRPFESGLRLAELPHYAWNNQTYWIQYEGDWLLTKSRSTLPTVEAPATLETRTSSSLHSIISACVKEGIFRVEARTNVIDPGLLQVVEGHAMNSVGVVSSYVHTDMALAAAHHLLQASGYSNPPTTISVSDLLYHDPVCAQASLSQPQIVETTAQATSTAREVDVEFYRPGSEKSYAHCRVSVCDDTARIRERQAGTQTVSSRIAFLRESVASGTADKISGRLAYRLFANLVEHGEVYRNMTSVVMQGSEAFAEVTLPEAHGHWHLAPHWADALISLPGFVLNGGDVFDTKEFFYITPGWDRMTFARQLHAGEKLVSYVKVEQSSEQGCYLGDVFIFDAVGTLVGFVERVLYRRWPRVMLDRFFFPPDRGPPAKSQENAQRQKDQIAVNGIKAGNAETSPKTPGTATAYVNDNHEPDKEAEPHTNGNWVTAQSIIAEEIGSEISELADSAHIADLGIDSLMSLVISQRLREALGVEIRDAFFIEVNTVGELRELIGCI
ncbi:Non-reducing polyketide synthase PKS19 [Fulvia fulva]|nr:Non-reducing polyketide synthase PKS19 [Fulvia fulva]WPV21820.1 Non-reducing polyketide synthase PKS19 [Fulvia fulva]